MRIAFEAIIREVKNKSLVSGDKSTRVILEFDSIEKLDVLNALNELHYADRNVAVVIMDLKESSKKTR